MAVTIVGNNTPTAGGVVYGDGTNYASTAAGTSGQVLTSAGSGTPTWTTPSAGALTLLATVTPTAAANVDFLSTFSATYDNYLILIDNIAPSSYAASPQLKMLFANSGTADTASNYVYRASYYAYTNLGATTTTATSFISSNGLGAGYFSGSVQIYNVNDATNSKWGNYAFCYSVSAASDVYGDATVIGYIKAATVSGIRFNWSTGTNFAATGKIRVYGYSNS